MGCNCGRRRKKIVTDSTDEIMGGYKYLKPHQVKARLEVFKRNNCKECKSRYHCDYNMYLGCKGKAPKMA